MLSILCKAFGGLHLASLLGFALSSFALGLQAPVFYEPRLALVIGNVLPIEIPLTNPVNDARSMEATLTQQVLRCRRQRTRAVAKCNA